MMGGIRSARLAVLASLSLALSSGTVLRAHSSVFQMRKMASMINKVNFRPLQAIHLARSAARATGGGGLGSRDK